MAARRILIVDDDVVMLRLLDTRLKAGGYEVICAMDAIFAVSMAKEQKPDLIILDIGLPGGDGFLIMDQLTKIQGTIGIPVIILTGSDQSADRERALKAGAVAFFRKPPDHDEFMAAIRKALGEFAVNSAETSSHRSTGLTSCPAWAEPGLRPSDLMEEWMRDREADLGAA